MREHIHVAKNRTNVQKRTKNEQEASLYATGDIEDIPYEKPSKRQQI